MKNIPYFLLVCLIIGISTASANDFPSQRWHHGKVYLENGEFMEGMVKYDLENNLVKVQNNTIKTFSAVSIQHFEIFDYHYGGSRVFYSLPYSPHYSDYTIPKFFELLYDGDDITLLCREYITVDNRVMNNMGWTGMHMGPMWGPPVPGMNRLAFQFYFLNKREIMKYNQKKKELFDLMDDKSAEIRLFMDKNRLSHDRRGDLLRITAYYNQLKRDSDLAKSAVFGNQK
jgi:hypothetical protein